MDYGFNWSSWEHYFKNGQGSTWVFQKQREDQSSFISEWFEVINSQWKGLETLVQTMCFSEDIGMEFGIEECAMLVEILWNQLV